MKPRPGRRRDASRPQGVLFPFRLEVGVDLFDSFVQRRFGLPAEVTHFPNVEELSRGAVGFAAVPTNGAAVTHDFSHGFRESLAEPGGRERLADAMAANPPVRHPVVQTHPETGKKVLFVNALFTTHIEGLPPLESAEVLQFLWRHASLPEFTCRFSWAPDSLVLWDNRSTQHKPVNDFFPATRRLHRVVSEGDQPY